MSVDTLSQAGVCIDCKSTESSFWHKCTGGALCTTCYCQRDSLNRTTRSQGVVSSNTTSANKFTDESRSSDNSCLAAKSGSTNITRKSSRLKPLTKHKPWPSVAKPSSIKGRSKRIIFKKNVTITC